MQISLLLLINSDMNLSSFKKDMDELIEAFSVDYSTSFADMKKVWILKKFSYIYEASPSTNLTFFMQSLYAHSIGYITGFGSLSQRLGGLYSLYCLYETQPFKPPFRVYLSLGELKKLKEVVIAAKETGVKAAPALVGAMLEKNMLLLGAVELNETSVPEKVNQLTKEQNACIEKAYERLFYDTHLENFLHMDLAMEADLDLLKKISAEYGQAKHLAIEEASKVIDVEDVKHISEQKILVGDVAAKIAEDWKLQKETFYKQTGFEFQQLGDQGFCQEIEELLMQED